MKKEYDFNKLKRVKKGPVVSKDKTKISKTIRLDFAVVEWLITESDRRGVKYQSLINALLKEAMEAGGAILNETRVRQIVRDELKRRAS
ncbi:MAG: BrnA antitoxin family protein [Deltaproteobacteria bacterium]|nr:BrnA antitoxin family protein [Deltaproteobacteria bacterium]